MSSYVVAVYFVVLTVSCMCVAGSAISMKKHLKIDTSLDWSIIALKNNLKMIERVDKNDVLHMEFYRRPVVGRIARRVPLLRGILKPVAKAGIRRKSTQTNTRHGYLMEEFIQETFFPQLEEETEFSSLKGKEKEKERDVSLIDGASEWGSDIVVAQKRADSGCDLKVFLAPRDIERAKYEHTKIGLLVYMWVAPRYRKQGMGDMVLAKAISACLSKGDQFLLMVHDDSGSGRLIDWYKQRGFVSTLNVLEKGLIGRLK